MAEVTLRDVKKSFGKTDVLHGIDLDIASNEFCVFVGPSGCGKSTLLRLIAGLEDLTDGSIHIGSEDVSDLPPSERGIAMVFQSYALYPHMSVYENMAFGLKLAKLPKSAIDERVRDAAKILQLDALLDRKPKQLSGGQRQRVAIGRAIVREPKVFLFDEPLSNLDAALRVQMRIEIAKLHHSLDATMIYVTHDQVEAMTLADKIVVLHDGYVEQVGSPLELYNNPRNLFVAGFIGSPKMNFLDSRISSVNDGSLVISVTENSDVALQFGEISKSAQGQNCTLGLRPEHLTLTDPSQGVISGKAVAVERLGGETYVYIEHGAENPLVVKSEGNAVVRPGETIGAQLDPMKSYLFDAKGEVLGSRQAG